MHYKETVSDRIANAFVKRILLLRGSKKLFSDVNLAKENLDELRRNRPVYTFPEVKTKQKTVASSFHGIPVLTFAPENKKQAKLVWLPGGAFAREPSVMHYKTVDSLVSMTGISADVIVYPKAPVYGAEDTMKLLTEYYDTLLNEMPSDKIFFAGDSAGGAIWAQLIVRLKKTGRPMPGLVLLFSPLLDIRMNNAAMCSIEKKDPMLGMDGLRLFADAWFGNEPAEDYNPVENDISCFPKTLIFSGTSDILSPDDVLFAEKAKKNGVDIQIHLFENMYHCFVLYPLAASKQAKRIAADAIIQCIRS